MSTVKRWNSQEGWNEWVNADSTERAPRIIGNELKLPFQRIPHLGLGSLLDGAGVNDELIARWSFGQRGNVWNTLNVDSINDDDTLNPGVGGNVTHTLSIPSAALPFVERSEFGFNSKTRQGYAIISGDSDFEYPESADADSEVYISCWVKSNITNYSGGMGIIAGYYDNLDDPITNSTVYYMLAIGTDNRFKAYVSETTLTEIPPLGGEVTVDNRWHHLLFAIGRRSPIRRSQIFVIDNDWGTGPLDSVHNISMDVGVAGKKFTIGSSENPGETSFGFSGIIDELVVANWLRVGDTKTIIADNSGSVTPEMVFGTYTNSHRFESKIFLSDVFDTGRNNSLLLNLYTEYETPNGASVEFSFRASDTLFNQTDTSVVWSGFTAPNHILTGTNANINDLGVYVRGRYHQVRARLSPSDIYSSVSDPLQLDTPVLQVVEIDTGVSNKLLPVAMPTFEPGTIVGQIVNFAGTQTISKASLNLTVISSNRQEFIVGSSGTLSFQAANFWESRDEWVFQPVIHWASTNGWETSGTTIQNTLQNQDYDSVEDAVINAPYLTYRLFFPSGGNYYLWGYGYTSGNGIYWALDGDTTHLRGMTLGNDSSGWSNTPQWTNFGSIFLNEGGIHTFTVYVGENNTTILDQWYFTTNANFSNEVELDTPMPLSQAPFNTLIRLRSLYGGELDDLVNPNASPSESFTAYLSSRVINASGKFNYEIRDAAGNGIDFIDGLSIEYWQLGGGEEHFAAWDMREIS